MPERSIPFEVRAGRPVEIFVRDDEGRRWVVRAGLVVGDVRSLGGRNADGSPLLEFDLQVSMSNLPVEEEGE